MVEPDVPLSDEEQAPGPVPSVAIAMRGNEQYGAELSGSPFGGWL
jgi:hypothetical protein